MLYNTKLNEFEPEQLDLFLSMVNEKVADIVYNWSTVQKFDPSEFKQHKEAVLKWQFDSVTLLKVQLENAKKDIQQMRQPTNGLACMQTTREHNDNMPPFFKIL